MTTYDIIASMVLVALTHGTIGTIFARMTESVVSLRAARVYRDKDSHQTLAGTTGKLAKFAKG